MVTREEIATYESQFKLFSDKIKKELPNTENWEVNSKV